MIEGGKGLYALAVANPVFAGILTAAIVGAIGILIYMNYSKASQIGEIRETALDACKKDNNGNLVKDQSGKLKLNDGQLSTCMDKIMGVLALNPTPKQQV